MYYIMKKIEMWKIIPNNFLPSEFDDHLDAKEKFFHRNNLKDREFIIWLPGRCMSLAGGMFR